MTQYFYSLIRFVPDIERMEPFNVGIILQSQSEIDFRLSPHAAKRKDVDTAIFQKWRVFLENEVRGAPVPFLQPPKHSRRFLEYLCALCDRTINISKPLVLAERAGDPFEEVLRRLYDRLVAPSEPQRREHSDRPTSTFRDIEEEKQFRKRGMKRHPYIDLPSGKRWNAYRQVLNSQNIVVDKVEVGNIVGQTTDEIQKLSSGVDAFLDRFLGEHQPSAVPRYVLIADELEEKFTDQSDQDFQAMKEELQKVLDVVSVHGGQLIRNADEVRVFAEDVDRNLPAVEDLQRAG